MSMLAGYNDASIAGYLKVEELVSIFQRFWDEYWNRYPLLSLFKVRRRLGRQFIVDQVINLLTTGKLTSKPGPGLRLDQQMIARKLTEVMFDQYVIDLKDDHFLSLIDSDRIQERGTYRDVNSLEDAVAELRRDTAKVVRTLQRTMHKTIADIMSSPNGATINVDGIDYTFDWKFLTATFGSDWATASNDIMSDFAQARLKFSRRNGGLRPNVYVVHEHFHDQFILPNDELRENFLVRFPNFLQPFLAALDTPAAMSERSIDASRVIRVSDAWVDESGGAASGDYSDLTDVWPLNFIGMGYVDPNEEDFLLNTCRTLDNDMMGGVAIRPFIKEDPTTAHIRVSGNHVPSFADSNKWMIYKVSATSSVSELNDI